MIERKSEERFIFGIVYTTRRTFNIINTIVIILQYKSMPTEEEEYQRHCPYLAFPFDITICSINMNQPVLLF